MYTLFQFDNPRSQYIRLSLVLLVTSELLFAACDDDPVSSGDQADPSAPRTVEGQINNYDRGEQRTWAGPGLAEGTISAAGTFLVTLEGLDEIEDDLELSRGRLSSST